MVQEFFLPFSISRDNYAEIPFSAYYAEIYNDFERLELLKYLHPEELKKHNEYSSTIRKDSYLLGRYCAKKALGQLYPRVRPTNINIQSGVFSQPIVNSHSFTNTKISISHIKDSAIAIAFPEKHPMAIDIESMDNIDLDYFYSLLTSSEKGLITDLNFMDKSMLLTGIWGAKECLGKVLGTGLTTGLEIFNLDMIKITSEGDIEITFQNFIQYKAFSIRQGNKAISIITPKNSIFSHLIPMCHEVCNW
jgi:4'-phosphopantetheinyl transferase